MGLITYKEVKSGNADYCEIPLSLCPALLTALSNFNYLQQLDLSGNTLTGCLPNFIPQSFAAFASLEQLFLSGTSLNIDDLKHLISLIQDKKLPNLNALRLNFNNFQGFENRIEQLIEAGITHHKRELTLGLVDTALNADFVKKWQSQCTGTNENA